MHAAHAISATITETDALSYGSLVDYSVTLSGWKIVRLYHRDGDDEVEPPVIPAEDSKIFDFQPY